MQRLIRDLGWDVSGAAELLEDAYVNPDEARRAVEKILMGRGVRKADWLRCDSLGQAFGRMPIAVEVDDRAALLTRVVECADGALCAWRASVARDLVNWSVDEFLGEVNDGSKATV